jgi:tetratricopeptide (TPR) repeat protein
MQESKKTISSYFENLSLLMVGILFTLLPLFFLSTTTDAFVLPKELLVIGLTTLALLIFALKMIIEGKLSLRTSPFDVPVTLLMIIALVSAILSTNRYDGLIAVIPVLFVGFLYFTIVNTVKNQKQLLFLLATLTAGTVISSVITALSFFGIYPLPFAYSHVTYFTAFGSLLDQGLYYAVILPIAGYFGYGFINNKAAKKSEAAPFTQEAHEPRKKSIGLMGAFGIAFIIIAIGLGITIFMLFTSQKPLILPFSDGLTTAFAAISQGTNVFKSLLLGSGFGTYLNDFTMYKPVAYNADQTLWAFTFFRSSSFALELLATTGILGIVTFIFLIFRVIREKNYFLPLMIVILAAIFLPFSFTMIALFFILLALFAIVCMHNDPRRFGEAEFSLVALRRGLFGGPNDHVNTNEHKPNRILSKILPTIFLLIVVIVVGVPLYFVTRFAMSDVLFQQSLVAESQNNGLATYQLQTASISMFPYRDIYYRAFAQTNLALANALAVNQPKGQKVSPQTQKDILTLIQQSINAGRAAITISPATSFNWNNLSSIYRSLIGFGQNADQFTILTLNQAIALDQNNPQQYIDLGGVYYQLGKYDDAIREFQIAINLKQDYANAYYNLGHAYEQKGDFQNAMTNYNTVKQLVAGNATNMQKINSDINALNSRISDAQKAQQTPQKQQTPAVTPVPPAAQQAIGVDKSSTPPLPTRIPREQIPGPSVSPQQGPNSPTTAPTK